MAIWYPNWLASEKSLLLDLISDRFSLLENKKTDSVSVREKLAEWRKISDLYNAQSDHIHRTPESLKAQWESMKQIARKEAFGITHGGTPKDPFHTRMLGLILPSAGGLHNPLLDTDSSNQDINERQTIMDVQITAECAELFDDDVKVEHDTDMVVGNDTAIVPRPMKFVTHNEEENRNTKSVSAAPRRRPLHPAMASLQMLHKKKIEAMKTQFRQAKEQQESHKLNSIKVESNELDLEIKREMLKQEKIKTKILLLDLKLKRKQCENI